MTSEDRVSGSSSCTRARYRHSFVYLKFPANPRESGSPRKRHATTYSPDRRTNVRPSRCVGSCMDNFITCIGGTVCVCVYIYIHIEREIGGTVVWPRWRGRVVRGGWSALGWPSAAAACARRNYTIKWCPDGRQLGAPGYGPFSSCHSESICIVMAPRFPPPPTPRPDTL